jgi:hypothetical protein
MTIIPSKERLLAVFLKGFLNGGGIRTTAGSTPLYRKVFLNLLVKVRVWV